MRVRRQVTARFLAVVCLLGATGLRAEEEQLPKLVDLGAHKCIACKKMAPILEQLKKDYAGRFETEFIDVWEKENAEKAREYGIRLIPTQIFLDVKGKELWRHEGYISKEDILKKWKELGYAFEAPGNPQNEAQETATSAGREE